MGYEISLWHSSLSLCFGTGKPILYTDSDMAGDVDTRKSTSGYLVCVVGMVGVCLCSRNGRCGPRCNQVCFCPF